MIQGCGTTPHTTLWQLLIKLYIYLTYDLVIPHQEFQTIPRFENIGTQKDPYMNAHSFIYNNQEFGKNKSLTSKWENYDTKI